jgi:hypothetical protein
MREYCARAERSRLPNAFASLRVASRITTSVRAAVFVDEYRVAQDVTEATVTLPADGQQHTLRVEALGYQIWEIKLASDLQTRRRFSGPVKLKRQK